MVATEQPAQSTDVARSPSPTGLPAAYEHWRSSRLGQITDALEERVLLDLLGPVRGLSVLDVGCGDGVLGSALARRGAHVTGLDTDPQMLAAAERRAQNESIELHLVRGRAEALPFESETFDRVVAVTVLCFVREADRAIGEIARVLKPGGHLVIGELGRWSLWAAVRRVKGWFGAPTWKAVRFHTAKKLRSLLEAHGLNVDKTVGAIYYPPIGIAALLLARFETWCARWTSIGAAFVAVLASKRNPRRVDTPEGNVRRSRRHAIENPKTNRERGTNMMDHRMRSALTTSSVAVAAVSAAVILAPALSWAQSPAEPERYLYGPHMMWGGGWYGMIFGPLFMILVLVAVIAGVGLVSRWFGTPWYGAQPPHQAPPGRTPLDILRERFARGEIDKEEFEERRRVLGE